MKYADDNLTDAGSTWFPFTNGIAYWNESFGPDTTPPTIHVGDSSLWYSDMMNNHWITMAPDINGDGVVAGVDSSGGYAIYYASQASMPNAGFDSTGNIWLSFSAYTETVDNGSQVYRHLYVTRSEDGGNTWSCPSDVTPHHLWSGMQECVFGSMSPVVDDKIRIIYQQDFEPGLSVRGDEDIVDNNNIIYLEIDTVGLFNSNVLSVYGCMDSLAINYDASATTDDGSCSYCNISNTISVNPPSSINSCDGVILTNSSSNYPIILFIFTRNGTLLS